MRKSIFAVAGLLAACGGVEGQTGPATFHGGWVMGGDLKVHVIFAGGWNAPAEQRVVDFLGSLDGSPWMAILTTYPDTRPARPSGRLILSGVSHEPAQATVEQLYAMLATYPPAMDTLYMVVAARGESIAGLSNVGGYHTITNRGVVFSVSTDSGDDALTLTLSHELAEAVTDPVPDAGWLRGEAEIADMCQASSGRQAGFLVTALWKNDTGCSLF